MSRTYLQRPVRRAGHGMTPLLIGGRIVAIGDRGQILDLCRCLRARGIAAVVPTLCHGCGAVRPKHAGAGLCSACYRRTARGERLVVD